MTRYLGTLASVGLIALSFAGPAHANRISDEHCAPGQTLNPFTSICEGPTPTYVFVTRYGWFGGSHYSHWRFRHRFHHHRH
jgi:hypothetical protein